MRLSLGGEEGIVVVDMPAIHPPFAYRVSFDYEHDSSLGPNYSPSSGLASTTTPTPCEVSNQTWAPHESGFPGR